MRNLASQETHLTANISLRAGRRLLLVKKKKVLGAVQTELSDSWITKELRVFFLFQVTFLTWVCQRESLSEVLSFPPLTLVDSLLARITELHSAKHTTAGMSVVSWFSFLWFPVCKMILIFYFMQQQKDSLQISKFTQESRIQGTSEKFEAQDTNK